MPNTLPTITPNCFTTAGPVQIWVNTGDAGAFEYLGDTRNGAKITEKGFFDELKSDLSGGEKGPAADYQFLGEEHTIELELGRYSEDVLAKLEVRVNPTVTRTKGMLIACATGFFQLVLISANFARKYTRVFVLEPIERAPIGTPVMFPRVVLLGAEDEDNDNSSPWNSSITVSGSSLS